MSYDFSQDKQGAQTPVVEQPANGSEAQESNASGTKTPSIDGCRTKKILSVLEAKGLKLCGDLVMGDDSEIYLSDGTAGASLVKDISFAYGRFEEQSDGNGGTEDVFVHADPALMVGPGATDMAEPIVDGDLSSVTDAFGNPQAILDDTGATAGAAGPTNPSPRTNGWFLMITRPNQVKEFKAMTMVDDLFDAVGASGKVVSILGAVQEVEELQEIVKAALDAERLVRAESLEALEDSMNLSLSALQAFLVGMESALSAHITAGDAEVMAHLDSRFNTLRASLVAFEDGTRFHGHVQLPVAGDASCDTGAQFEIADVPADRASDITKWMIELSLQDSVNNANAKRRGDLEIEYEAQFAQVDSGETDDNGDAIMVPKLQVTTHFAPCADDASAFLVCNAIYCGDILDSDIDSGSDGTLANSYVAPNTLSINTGDAANPYIDQDTENSDHDAGQKIKVEATS